MKIQTMVQHHRCEKKIGKHHQKADAIKKVIAAYHTDDVKKVIEETSDGLDQPVW